MGADLKYYPLPSSVNVANFVTVRPCVNGDDNGRGDFRNWKEQMSCLLESQDVLGFVDGEIEQPPDENEYKKAWRRTDRLVKGWMLGSIGNDALDAVSGKETARDVWLELHSIFKKQVEKEKAPARNKAIEEEEEDGKRGSGDDSSSCSRYLSLYKAAQGVDWDNTKNDTSLIDELSTTVFSSYSETPLHVAVMTGKAANHLVKKLVETMQPSALAHKNYRGNTALHDAAMVGNTEAAAALLQKCPRLLLTAGTYGQKPAGTYGQKPVILAALYNQTNTLEYLISKHEENEKNKAKLSQGKLGLFLLRVVINSDNIDFALELVNKYPDMALRDKKGQSALSTIAGRDNLFPSSETFNWWQSFTYRCIPLKKPTSEARSGTTHNSRDIENLSSNGDSTSFQMINSGVVQKLKLMIWNAIETIVPKSKELRERKARHQQARQLVQYLCKQITSRLSEKEAIEIFESSIKLAATLGIVEVVEIIIKTFPSAIYHVDPETGMDIFLLAAAHRFENIFNLIGSMGDSKYKFYSTQDKQGNNLLHICGKLAPPNRRNLVTGAALQMQRELQWFKEAENFVQPYRRTIENNDNETPQMVFTREHKELKAEGETWMKDTANACTIPTTLIATVVFAAAFTVPGGVDSATGIPLQSGKPVFKLFVVSNAVSFFTSVTSLLMFLSILTSRYAEQDFLHILPKKLAIGLLSLFVSIAFMLTAFSAALYILFQRDLVGFGMLVVALAAYLVVTSLLMQQFPLFVEVIRSAYGPGIFGKKSDRLL